MGGAELRRGDVEAALTEAKFLLAGAWLGEIGAGKQSPGELTGKEPKSVLRTRSARSAGLVKGAARTV